MKQEGHQVGNHTVTHPSMPDISVEKQKEELKSLRGLYERGYWLRNGYIFPDRQAANTANAYCSWQRIWDIKRFSGAWHIWIFDVNNQPGKDYVIEHFDKYYHNGAIPLMHNVSQSNAEALDTVLSNLTELGYRFVSLDEMFEK